VATPQEPGRHLDPTFVGVLDFDENRATFRAHIPGYETPAARLSQPPKNGLTFQRDCLLESPTLPQGELEAIEQLEQLTLASNGWKIASRS